MNGRKNKTSFDKFKEKRGNFKIEIEEKHNINMDEFNKMGGGMKGMMGQLD